MLKRITKFIPKSDALFKSHLSYCISIEEGFQSINYKIYFQHRKDVCVFYLVTIFHLIMQVIVKHVRECAVIKSICPQKVTAWNTLSQSSMNLVSLTCQTCIFSKHL